MNRRIQQLSHVTSLDTGDYLPIGPLSADLARRTALNDIFVLYNQTYPSVGGGEINTITNLLDGSGIYLQKVGPNLQIKSLSPNYYLPITGGTGSLGYSVDTTKVLVADTSLLSENPNVKTIIQVGSGNPQGYFAVYDSGNINDYLLYLGYPTAGGPVKTEFKGNDGISAGLFNRRELSGNWKLNNSEIITNANTPVFTTGNQNIDGTKTFSGVLKFYDIVNNQYTMVAESDEGVVFNDILGNPVLNTLTPALLQTWAAGTINATALNVGGNPVAISSNLTSTGQTLWNRIISLSGDLQVTGKNLYNLYIGMSGSPNNLTTTGQTLWNRITSLSGDLQTTGSRLITITNTISGNLNTTGKTCYDLASTANSTADVGLALAQITSDNLTTTGVNLINTIQGLSGRLIATGYNSYILTTGASGVLNTKINDLSGYCNSTFETKTDATNEYFLINQDIADLQAGLLDNGNLITGVSNNLTTTGQQVVWIAGNQYIGGTKWFWGNLVFFDDPGSFNSFTVTPGGGVKCYDSNENLVLQAWDSKLSGIWGVQSLKVVDSLTISGHPVATGSINNGVTGLSINDTGSLIGGINFNAKGTISITNTGNSILISGASSASTDTIANLTTDGGSGIYYQKVGGEFQLKSIKAGNNITITGSDNVLTIDSATSNNSDGTNLSGNLQSTGSLLNNRIISLSGDLANTGNILNNRIISLSGDLFNTGRILNSRIVSLSGDLFTTGNNLWNNIKTISGDLTNLSGDTTILRTTGTQTIFGQKTFSDTGIYLYDNIYVDNFYIGRYNDGTDPYLSIRHNETVIPTQGLNIWSNKQITIGGILYGISPTDLTHLLQVNGGVAASQIDVINGIRPTVNGTGILLQSEENPNSINLSGNLTNTGVNLWNRIVSLSGDLFNTGSVLNNKINSLSGNLGNTGSILSNYIVSLSGDLIASGSKFWLIDTPSASDYPKIKTIGLINNGVANGYFGIYDASTNRTVHFVGYQNSTFPLEMYYLGSDGNMAIKMDSRELSGNWKLNSQVISTGNSDGVALSGNLQSTGSILNNRIISLSGDLQATGALAVLKTTDQIINGIKTLTNGGLNLYDNTYLVNRLSWSDGSPLAINDTIGQQVIDFENKNLKGGYWTLSGNPISTGNTTLTGQILNNRIMSLSGDLQQTGSNLYNFSQTGNWLVDSDDASKWQLVKTNIVVQSGDNYGYFAIQDATTSNNLLFIGYDLDDQYLYASTMGQGGTQSLDFYRRELSGTWNAEKINVSKTIDTKGYSINQNTGLTVVLQGNQIDTLTFSGGLLISYTLIS